VSCPLFAPAGVRSSSSSRLLTEKRLEFSVAVKLTSSDTDVDVEELLGVRNAPGVDCSTPAEVVISILP
jgi:hypothetical protein